MAILRKELYPARDELIEMAKAAWDHADFEVLQIGTQTYAIPVVSEDRMTEGFVKVVFSVPTGNKEEVFDAYAEAKDFEFNQRIKQEKAQEAKKRKEAKAKFDKEKREKTKEIFERNKTNE